MKKIGLALWFYFLLSPCLAQDFEGKILFAPCADTTWIDNISSAALDQFVRNADPRITHYYRKSWLRSEEKISMRTMELLVIDLKIDSLMYYISRRKQRYTIFDIDSSKHQITYQYLNQYKTILGYKCQKVIVFYKHSNIPRVIYYTTELPNVLFRFLDLKGCPLYVQYNKNDFFIATSIIRESLPDSLFTIPKDYIMVDRRIKKD